MNCQFWVNSKPSKKGLVSWKGLGFRVLVKAIDDYLNLEIVNPDLHIRTNQVLEKLIIVIIYQNWVFEFIFLMNCGYQP
jgi:hypothetical protein